LNQKVALLFGKMSFSRAIEVQTYLLKTLLHGDICVIEIFGNKR